MNIDFGCGEKEIDISFYTLVVYEQQFGSDMIKDVFGKVGLSNDENSFVMDFTQNNWTNIVKALWACIKTKDQYVEPFESWSKSISDVDISKLANTLVPEIYGRLFRYGASVSE